jgi:hypothetical protein
MKPADKNLELVVMRVSYYHDAVRVHVCEEVAGSEKAFSMPRKRHARSSLLWPLCFTCVHVVILM